MTKKEAAEKLQRESKLLCHGCMHPQEVGWCENHCKLPEAFDMAIQALEAQRWIPVNERPPEEGQDILAYRILEEDERIIPANYSQGCWFDCHMNCSEEHIVAWMSLPEPYKFE